MVGRKTKTSIVGRFSSVRSHTSFSESGGQAKKRKRKSFYVLLSLPIVLEALACVKERKKQKAKQKN